MENLGSIIVNSTRRALSNPDTLNIVQKRQLWRLALKQGLHGYAADTLREIKNREDHGEECSVIISKSKLLVYGEVLSITEDLIMLVEVYSGPSTLIKDDLSRNEIDMLLSMGN